jgi:predicted amidohydrolase
VPTYAPAEQQRVLDAVSASARKHGVVTVMGMEWIADAGRQIAAVVFDADGAIQGIQTKNQLDPTEEAHYVHGDTRRVFEVNGVTFGVAICHEAFRYPETVRWAAVRGAKLVFHPHCTGSDRTGSRPSRWGDPASPYYEKAMMCRGLENGIFFASVNYAFRNQDSATTIVGPQGECVAHLPYGEEGVLVREIDLEQATGLLASRYAPERYRDGGDAA